MEESDRLQTDPPGEPIRVFLIGNHQILLWGLQQLVDGSRFLRLVGSAASLDDALPAIATAKPDVVVLDLDMDPSLPAEVGRLTTSSPAKVLAMTRRDDQVAQDKAILDGARGILDRQASAETFLGAIIKVHEGQLWLDRAATGRIFVELSRRETAAQRAPERSRVDSLTEREKHIVACIFENTGSSAKTLAQKLLISESTLRNHLTSIYGKLGLSNRFELISFVHKHDHLVTRKTPDRRAV